MNLAEPLRWLDRVRAVPVQRSVLIAGSVAAAVAASALTGVVAGDVDPVVMSFVFAIAVVATLRPDHHTALLVETIVVWHWFASTEDRLTPWAMPMALCIFVFHAGIALMSVAPLRATIDRTIIWRWTARSGCVVLATVAVWFLAVVLDGRQAPGSAAVTLAAFVTLTGLVLAARLRSAPSGSDTVPPAESAS